MPLNNERPTSTSSGDDQGSDVESLSERCDSMTLAGNLECSRESFTSNDSSKLSTPSSSPSKTLTLEEVMETARVTFTHNFCHEVIVNKDFRMEANLPQNSLWKVVEEIVHKAYWDILETELNDDPPEYEHAIKLLEEIREILLSFLYTDQNRMRTQIMEALDMDLIRQQADNNAVDIHGIASYVITTMGKLCAPFRDKEIKKLRENTDNIVTLFREIFRVLELMRVDSFNGDIKMLRYDLQRYGGECERRLFQDIVDKSPNALNRTTSWIKSALEEVLSATEQTSGHGKGQPEMPVPFQVLNTAFLRLLTWDYKTPLPETWKTDESRLREIQWQLHQGQAVNAVMLIVVSTVGEPIQGLPSLSDRLTLMISVLLEGMHRSDFNLQESLADISAKICCELNKSLTERNYPPLTPELQATLTGQICSITQKDNPIRTLVEDRVQQYFKALIYDLKPQVKLEQVPTGLTAIKPVLGVIGSRFISLINYNRAVYAPFYSDIIEKLMFSSSPPAASPPRDMAQDSVTVKK